MNYTLEDLKHDMNTTVNKYAQTLESSVIKTHQPEEPNFVSYRIDSKDESGQFIYRMDIVVYSASTDFTDAVLSAYNSIENYRRHTSDPAPLKEPQFALFSEMRALLRLYKIHSGGVQ